MKARNLQRLLLLFHVHEPTPLCKCMVSDMYEVMQMQDYYSTDFLSFYHVNPQTKDRLNFRSRGVCAVCFTPKINLTSREYWRTGERTYT